MTKEKVESGSDDQADIASDDPRIAELQALVDDAANRENLAVQRAEKAEADLAELITAPVVIDPRIAELEVALAAMKGMADGHELILADVSALLSVNALSDREDVDIRERIAGVASYINDLKTKIAELEADTAARVAPIEVAARPKKTIKIDAKAKRADFDAALIIAFSDGDGVMSRDLPVMTFAAERLRNENGARNLYDLIDFPAAIPQFIVTTAWLISDQGKAVARYDLVQPMLVGGGRLSRFNPGTLSFTFVDPAA